MTPDDRMWRLLVRCRATLRSCLHETEIDLMRPERAAMLGRRIADLDLALGDAAAAPADAERPEATG